MIDETPPFHERWNYEYINRRFYARSMITTRSLDFYMILNEQGSERYLGRMQFDDPTNIELGREMLIAFVRGYYEGIRRGKRNIRDLLNKALDPTGSDRNGW